MNCKYCHLTTHNIDKCPTILCKICKMVGHPQWLCKEKKINKFIPNNKILEKKYSFNDDIKKKDSEVIIIKNISYYLKIIDKDWIK